jgi:hypothetical protein
MKTLIRSTLGVAFLCGGLNASFCAETPAPGYFDFGKFSPPPSGGEFVEVDLKDSLISMAARLGEKSEPEVSGLLRGLQAVRVNVIGLTDENRAEMQERVKTIRSQLEARGWQRIVTAQNKGEDVGIYLKTRGAETVQGLVITVLDGKKEAVFVNIVGDLKPENLATIGQKFNIEPLKKLGGAAVK